MNENEFKDLVGQLADEHQSDTRVPRERMWQNIQNRRVQPVNRFRTSRWQVSLAMAAILVVGIGIGRWSQPVPDVGPVAEVLSNTKSPLPGLYQRSAMSLFANADTRLTDFKLSGLESGIDSTTTDWAAKMLIQARLLQGSPVGEEPEMVALLMDLELVLAQIVGISPENLEQDVAWVLAGLNNKSTLVRLRNIMNRETTFDSL